MAAARLARPRSLCARKPVWSRLGGPGDANVAERVKA